MPGKVVPRHSFFRPRPGDHRNNPGPLTNSSKVSHANGWSVSTSPHARPVKANNTSQGGGPDTDGGGGSGGGGGGGGGGGFGSPQGPGTGGAFGEYGGRRGASHQGPRAKPVRVYERQLSPRFYRSVEKDATTGKLLEFFKVCCKKVVFGPVQQGRTYRFRIPVQNETTLTQRAYASLVNVDAEHDCKISFDPYVAVVAPGMRGHIGVQLAVPRDAECGLLWDQISVTTESFVYQVPVAAQVLSIDGFERLAHEQRVRGLPVLGRGVTVLPLNKTKTRKIFRRARKRISMMIASTDALRGGKVPGSGGSSSGGGGGGGFGPADPEEQERQRKEEEDRATFLESLPEEDRMDLALVPTMRNVHWDPLSSKLVIDPPQFPFDLDPDVKAKDLPKLVAKLDGQREATFNRIVGRKESTRTGAGDVVRGK